MRRTRFFPLLSSLFLAACGAPGTTDDVVTQGGIKSGTPAKDYPASCLVDIFDDQNKAKALCSGAMIGPGVLLTAGHCVKGFASFHVNCPYLGEQGWGTGEPHPNFHATSDGKVAGDADDIGLVYLNAPIPMKQYPVLRSTEVPDGTLAVNVGRVLDTVVSRTDLYEGAAIMVMDGTPISFPHDYYSPDKIQPGDSGGPTYRAQAQPPEVIAVNSGAGTDIQVLSRVDLVYGWLKARVLEHGGFSLPPGYQPLVPQPIPVVPVQH